MSVQAAVGSQRRPAPAKPALLDVAAQVLVADPTASLADVAKAAGMGRTTLHKQYPTRQDLLVAVGHHAIDQCEQAVAAAVREDDDPAIALTDLVTAFVPLGPQLQFLFRQPSLDSDARLTARMSALEPPIVAVVQRAKAAGVLRAENPDWWFVSTLYALVYVAWEGTAYGWLARRDAPDLVLRTLLHGVGAPA